MALEAPVAGTHDVNTPDTVANRVQQSIVDTRQQTIGQHPHAHDLLWWFVAISPDTEENQSQVS